MWLQPLTLQNVGISVSDYLDQSKSENSKKLERQVVKLFHATIEELSKKDQSVVFKQIDDYTLEELPVMLSQFFLSLAKEDGKIHSSSSLMAYFGALARYLRLRENEPVDIKSNVAFRKVLEVVKARQTDAAKQGFGPGKNKSDCLTTDEPKMALWTRKTLNLLKKKGRHLQMKPKIRIWCLGSVKLKPANLLLSICKFF